MKVTEIRVAPCTNNGEFYITNALGVSYYSDSFDHLIRAFVAHTDQPATDFGVMGISVLNQKKI